MALNAVPSTEVTMRNPWLTKNPFMSAWLSAANRAAGAARGHATATANREIAKMQTTAVRQMMDFWTGQSLTKPVAPIRRKKR
jgi:hypothetical protein